MIQAEKTVIGSKVLQQHLEHGSPIIEAQDESMRSSREVKQFSQAKTRKNLQLKISAFTQSTHSIQNTGFSSQVSTRNQKYNHLNQKQNLTSIKNQPQQHSIENLTQKPQQKILRRSLSSKASMNSGTVLPKNIGILTPKESNSNKVPAKNVLTVDNSVQLEAIGYLMHKAAS